MVVTKTTHVEILAGSGLEAPNGMTMGPWIQGLPISSLIKPTLNGRLSLLLEELPWIGDVAGPLGGPGGAQGLLPYPLVSMCPYLSPFWSIFAIISCIQIILQAQVELGEL